VSGVVTAVAAHLWQATLVLALMALLAPVLRRAPARYVEALWTVGLLKLLVPLPLVAAAWSAADGLLPQSGSQSGVAPAMQTLSQIAYPEVLWTRPVEPSAGGGADGVLSLMVALWAVGAAVLLVRWWQRLRLPVPSDDPPWRAADDLADRLARVARSAGVPLDRVRVTSAPMVPCVRGLRRPVVVLSESVIRSLRDDELHAVLLHEDAHRRRGDLWRSLIEAVATRVFFFYPPAWYLSRRLRASAEMACDEAVLAAGVEAGTYARALARIVVLELAPSPAPAVSSGPSHLRARLQRIQQPERYATMKRHRLAVIAAVVVAIGISFLPAEDTVGLSYAEPLLPAAGPAIAQRPGDWLPASDLRDLDGLDVIVALPSGAVRISEALDELALRGGFEVYVTNRDYMTRSVTVATGSPVRVQQALEVLGERAGLEYRVVDRATLIVRFRPEVRAQRELEQVEASLRRQEAGNTAAGTLRVRALDPNGAPLTGVMVVARGSEGPRTEYTGIDGTARFAGLGPGAYTTTFTLAGFEIATRDGLEIRPQRTTAFDITLGRQR